jgi:glycine/D-amino acid oxidase-like deaminating enzyme
VQENVTDPPAKVAFSSESPWHVDHLPERTDVVVVGGGIAGTSAAYHLAKAGVEVVLMERGSIGGGATAAAVGILSPPLRQPFHETVHFRGRAVAIELWQVAARSIQGLAQLLWDRGKAQEAGLDLSGGYVLAEPHTDHQMRLAYEALSRNGLPVDWLAAADVRRLCGGSGFTGGYRIEGGGSLNPGAATTILAQAAEAEGACIVENVDVIGTHVVADAIVCEADGASTKCTAVVYATHVDSGRFSEFVQEEIMPIRGQGFASEPMPKVFHGSFSTYWKLNAWRQDSAGRILMSGWRHDAWDRAYGQPEPALDGRLQDDIHRWFEACFPASAPLQVKDRWSGVFGWTADFLPMVGPIPGSSREFIITGFSGGGVPFAFECGRSIAQSVVDGTPTDGCGLFSPSRFQRA